MTMETTLRITKERNLECTHRITGCISPAPILTKRRNVKFTLYVLIHQYFCLSSKLSHEGIRHNIKWFKKGNCLHCE